MGGLSSTEKTEFLKWIEHVLLPGMSKQYREQALQLFQNKKGGNDDNMMHWIQKQQSLDYERMWEEGLSQGLSQGLSKGVSQGQERINHLNALLLQDHRQEDLMRSVNDPTFQEQLIKEYCLDT
jgi:flagellar biosynthesis/type III secretory pathway protein FliH